MKRAWSFLAFIPVSLVFIYLAIDAIRPYLPFIGITLSVFFVGLVIFGVLRVLYHRRSF